MPKIPTRCSKAGCRKKQPCPDHPRGWASSTSPPLPANWSRLVRIIKARKNCATCGKSGTEVDHIVPRSEGGTDGIDNLQLLCHDCHSDKTRRESQRGMKRKHGKL